MCTRFEPKGNSSNVQLMILWHPCPSSTRLQKHAQQRERCARLILHLLKLAHAELRSRREVGLQVPGRAQQTLGNPSLQNPT